jgi:hypothetical protein
LQGHFRTNFVFGPQSSVKATELARMSLTFSVEWLATIVLLDLTEIERKCVVVSGFAG